MNKDLTTLFTGRHTTFLREVDSTNSYLARILRDKLLPEGSAIRTSIQNDGRGQAGSTWESETGKNLLASFVFYPAFIQPKEIFLLNKTFALAVYDFISSILKTEVRIKWPNDIYWKNKKVSGMLIENSMNSSSVLYSILGVGININQKQFSSSLINPVSFSIINHVEYDLDDLYASLCSCIEARYLQLKKGGRKTIDENYLEALYLRNEFRNYFSDGKVFKGRILSVDENGRLIVETEDGELRNYDFKEIKVVEDFNS